MNITAQHSYPKELYMTARTTVSTLEPLLFSSQGSNAYLGNRDYVWIIKAEERWKIVTIEVCNTGTQNIIASVAFRTFNGNYILNSE